MGTNKTKSVFVCQNCGAESPKWIGKCPSCKEWNTYQEEIISVGQREKSAISISQRQKPVLLENVASKEGTRNKSGISELDRILGGGMVPGSLILLGGEPGIGKSTIALQVALSLK
ncbi:MAG: DNA repair protein RadA, partial [Bacteroidales bacterium]|nr:DNA repair protein RadA [Bacteroidales bacterium]